MKLDQLLDRDKLAWHFMQKNISARCHPLLDLTILNYTHKCVYDAAWDEVTTKCRGLIYNDAGIIVARPWPKWWNFNDARHPETLLENLPKSQPEITEKLDGFLIIGFNYEGRQIFASRGSFASDHAKWATKWFEDHPCIFLDDETYLFEGISKELRIVLKYEQESAPLLGIVANEDGHEYGSASRILWGARNGGWPVAETFYGKDVETLAAENREGHEGYVLTWPRLIGPSFKVKIKHADYVRLHRATFGLTDYAVWEVLRDGGLPQRVLDVSDPDARHWIIGVENRLVDNYLLLNTQVVNYLNHIQVCRGRYFIDEDLQAIKFDRVRRAEFANDVKAVTQNEQIRSGIFARAFGTSRAFEQWLWKQVEPHPKTFYRQEGVE